MTNVVVAFDETAAQCSTKQFIAFMSVHRLVKSWSVPFRGLYIVKIEDDVGQFSDDIEKVLGQNNIFVANVEPESTGGRMAPGFWEWFNAEEITPQLVEAIESGERG